MAYLEVSGHKLFYEAGGRGSRALIFIHGLCGNHRVWSKITPAFIQDYLVIVIDLFGHGESSKDISPKTAFDILPSVIEKLIVVENVEAAVLIGHSIVGNILMSCIEANVKNIRSYVFVDCAFNVTDRVVRSRNQLADSILAHPENERGKAMLSWYKTMMDMNADPKDNELILSAQKNLSPTWMMQFLKATNFVRKFSQTNLPVLIFESNWLTQKEPERSFHNVFPEANYSRWPVSNHFFFVYNAEKFNETLRDFLSIIKI